VLVVGFVISPSLLAPTSSCGLLTRRGSPLSCSTNRLAIGLRTARAAPRLPGLHSRTSAMWRAPTLRHARMLPLTPYM
jgi:hypothetical protein